MDDKNYDYDPSNCEGCATPCPKRVYNNSCQFKRESRSAVETKYAIRTARTVVGSLGEKYAQFKDDVVRTWKPQGSLDMDAAIAALGMVCEAGEAGDAVKKFIAQDHPVDKGKIIDELGDTLYYMTAVMQIFDIDLREIMDANITKRAIRYPNGFDADRSINRGR